MRGKSKLERIRETLRLKSFEGGGMLLDFKKVTLDLF